MAKKLVSPGALRQNTLDRAAMYLAESPDTSTLFLFFSSFMKYKAEAVKKNEVETIKRNKGYDSMLKNMIKGIDN